ncbi:hypothetical protein ACIRPK_20505 [Kitasatospora sp. NPDC101801]|uniref:ApeA N-terminal domain 1-containing protein n=1 Tax=Kitasatospora sp. NPDC101801 TaxID=3364103 RepID=UPI0038022A4F
MSNVLMPTGTYECFWSLGDEPCTGQVVLEPGQGATGLVRNAPGLWSEDDSYRWFDQHTTEHARLAGDLTVGQRVLLIDALMAHNSPEVSDVFARLALVGSFPAGDDPLFDAVRFQVGGLSRLAGVPALDGVRFPREPERSFTATVHPNAAQVWKRPSGDRISLEFEIAFQTDMRFRAAVTSQPILEVTGAPRTAEQWVDDYVRPMAELAAFATGRRQDVEWVLLRPEMAGRAFTTQLFASGISQVPYLAEAPTDPRQPLLLRLGPDGADLGVLLERWQGLAEQHPVLHNHLVTVARQTPSRTARFMGVVPAIEAFHGEKHVKVPKAVFKQRRREVLERLVGAGAGQADLAWLDDWLPAYGDRALHERLQQLAEGLPEGVRTRIEAVTEPLPEALKGVQGTPLSVWHVMAKVRNNLAHGGEHPRTDQLELLCHLADTVAAALVLQEIGASEDLLVRAIDDHSWDVV